jgi:hypothetical protein
LRFNIPVELMAMFTVCVTLIDSHYMKLCFWCYFKFVSFVAFEVIFSFEVLLKTIN